MFLKVFDKAIDTTFEKNIEKYRNKLNRTTTAYELLLTKEMDFYSKLDPHLAVLAPLVQDLVYYAKSDETDKSTLCEEFREHLVNYLKRIPEMKNEIVLHQPYIPQDVFESASSLIGEMQAELSFWKETAKSLCGLNDTTIDVQKAEKISNAVLMRIAHLEFMIKKRLTELSEA
jgi:hypothetical protein